MNEWMNASAYAIMCGYQSIASSFIDIICIVPLQKGELLRGALKLTKINIAIKLREKCPRKDSREWAKRQWKAIPNKIIVVSPLVADAYYIA